MKNLIDIEVDENRADGGIKNEIIQLMRWDAFIDHALREVGNLKAKRAAGNDAREVVGVISVTNRIEVEPAVAPSDVKIENRLQRALAANGCRSIRDNGGRARRRGESL